MTTLKHVRLKNGVFELVEWNIKGPEKTATITPYVPTEQVLAEMAKHSGGEVYLTQDNKVALSY